MANMEVRDSDKSNTFMTNDDCFNQATLVASRWILDFLFVSVCRRFKEGNHEAFKDAMSTYKCFSHQVSLTGEMSDERSRICDFLAGVMQGKKIDAHVEDDDNVMPLISATEVWLELKDAVEDDSLFENITVLLMIQTVAVCLEKGKKTSANCALKWFDEYAEIPQKLVAKLSAIVAQMDTYHPFFTSFSFSRLLESVQSYLDTYLGKNSSDYLFKEAIKTIQSGDAKDAMATEVKAPSKKTTSEQEKTNGTKHQLQFALKTPRVCLPNISVQELLSIKSVSTSKEDKSMDAMEDTLLLQKDKVRTKRKLFSTKASVWDADPKKCVKPSVVKETNTSFTSKAKRQKWTSELDKKLKDGIMRHGRGNWAQILLDDDFKGRTGTMLKDRWRVLVKAHKVD
ncbi:telomeric repeat-binding factor 1 [Entelurus aequoreus]|uniref:telomeric repeat-binding factor 1 n=1 Tax=Entelurus aequoreus TaxID=161455 RepID=UPI002B1D64E7|nr:telomeric repeat-binding factor 1 [Entelurus aequoreus]